jgi:hypothetical protein
VTRRTSKAAFMSTMGRIGDEHVRTIASGADVAESYIRGILGNEAGALLEVLAPEDRAPVALEAFRRMVEDEWTPMDVTSWLSIEVRHMRWRGEDANKTASRIRSGRQTGGRKVSAAKRNAWQAWRNWICKDRNVEHPREASPSFKKNITNVIRLRAGASIPAPALNKRVPDDLPTVYGQAGKPPSEGSIRKNLFGRQK